MSLRFIFYMLALHKSLPQQNKLMRYLSTITITDESYALLAIQSETTRQRNISKINFICHSHWILATIIGIALGEKLAGSIPHLDFALPCLFAILAYEMYSHSSRLFPISLAILGFIVAKWLMPQWLILFAILFCIVALLIQYQCRSFTCTTK